MQFPGSDSNYHGDRERIIHLKVIAFKVRSGIGKQRSALTQFHKEMLVLLCVWFELDKHGDGGKPQNLWVLETFCLFLSSLGHGKKKITCIVLYTLTILEFPD